MLSSSVIINRFVSDVYMEDITNMKCQLRRLHSDKYFLQKHMIKIANIYGNINVHLLRFIYISWVRENIQHSTLANLEYDKISNYKYYK